MAGLMISGELNRWIVGMAVASEAAAQVGKRRWQAATDVMFDRSQAYVHVISGELKASGYAEADVDGSDLHGMVIYEADHAMPEHDRGGEHAYLQLAANDTMELFEQALPGIWRDVVMAWR